MIQIVDARKAREESEKEARGSFQVDLIWGGERPSLAGLRGTAKKYGGKYAASRDALWARIECRDVAECYGKHGRRYWVFGTRGATIARAAKLIHEHDTRLGRRLGEMAHQIDRAEMEDRDPSSLFDEARKLAIEELQDRAILDLAERMAATPPENRWQRDAIRRQQQLVADVLAELEAFDQQQAA